MMLESALRIISAAESEVDKCTAVIEGFEGGGGVGPIQLFQLMLLAGRACLGTGEEERIGRRFCGDDGVGGRL